MLYVGKVLLDRTVDPTVAAYRVDRDTRMGGLPAAQAGEYMELGSYFLFLQEQIKDIIIITAPRPLVHAHAAGEGSTDTEEDASQG